MDKFNLSGGVALRSAYGLPARNAAAPASYTTPWDAALYYHKLSFVEEGILRRRIRFGDDFHDEILMARFKA